MPKTHVETAPKSYLTRKNWCLTNKNWYLSLITTKSQVWPPKTLHFLTFDPQYHRICFPHPPPMEKISGDPPLDGVEPHVAHAISTCFRLVGIPESHQVMAGWLGYGSIPIIVQCYYPISSPIYNRYFPNYPIWVWINTYENSIFNGMNIHFNPAILMWTEGVLLVLTHCHLDLGVPWWLGWFLHLEHGDRIFQKHPGRWRHETNQFLKWSLRFGSPKMVVLTNNQGGIASSNGISGIWDGQLDMI